MSGKECATCLERKPVYEFPKCCDECNPIICVDCIAQHTQARLQEKATKISCPSCTQKYFDPIYLGIILGEKFKNLVNSLNDNISKEFLEEKGTPCPYPNCTGSFLVVDGDKYNKIVCPVCKRAFCYLCKAPWHDTYTCDQWINRKDIWAKQERESINTIKQISKPCPKCHIGIIKDGGCNHMTCKCSASFQYDEATWD